MKNYFGIYLVKVTTSGSAYEDKTYTFFILHATHLSTRYSAPIVGGGGAGGDGGGGGGEWPPRWLPEGTAGEGQDPGTQRPKLPLLRSLELLLPPAIRPEKRLPLRDGVGTS